MAEFIEITKAFDHKPTTVNVDDISCITKATVTRYPATQTGIFLRAQGTDDTGIGVEESYDSIMETFRKHGVNVFTVIPVEGSQQVLVPRAWLEAIQPVLKAFCENYKPAHNSKDRDPALPEGCLNCPLVVRGECVREKLPELIRGEIRG